MERNIFTYNLENFTLTTCDILSLMGFQSFFVTSKIEPDLFKRAFIASKVNVGFKNRNGMKLANE